MYKQIKLFIQDKLDTLSSTRIIMRVCKGIAEGLLEDTSLTKKEAKKIAYGAIDSIELMYDSSINPELYESPIETPSAFIFNMIMIRSIRSNEDYSNEVHQFCDDDVKIISEAANGIVGEEYLAIAEKKVLDGMLARYMNSFDKFGTVSKKYNGIWY